VKNEKPAPAALTIWNQNPRLKLTRGSAGEPIAVAAGVYEIDILYPNGRGGDLANLKNVRVETGGITQRKVNIERGNLIIDTYDQGSRVDAEVRFFKKSSKEPYVVVRGRETAELPVGVYEIEITHGSKSRWVSDMRVTAGSWETRKVEF